MRASAGLAAIAALLAGLAAACGGSAAQPFRIGVLADCYGPFGSVHELVVASTEAPLLRRGAKPVGKLPSDGVGSARVAGRRVELLQGCVSGTADVIPEARRLVEEEGAGAIVGPFEPQEGLVLASYARRRPGTVFLIQPSDAPELTLVRPAPNVFRFAPDASQTSAGLAGYAYHRLGWRTAVTVGDDLPYGWSRIAGFIAEFCALGGRIVHKTWLVPFGDSSSAATPTAIAADGIFFGASVSDSGRGLLRRLASLHRDIPKRLVAGDEVVGGGSLADGVVVASSLPPNPTPAAQAMLDTLSKSFPSFPAGGVLFGPVVSYRDGIESVLEGLQRAGGDAGKLSAALGSLTLSSPMGTIRLDTNHQAVLPVYLNRVSVNGGKASLRPLSVVRGVSQTFGGYFGAGSVPITLSDPPCVKRTPPPWAR